MGRLRRLIQASGRQELSRPRTEPGAGTSVSMTDTPAQVLDVAVIIPMMDRVNDLQRSLPSLVAQDYLRYMVYVIDGCSGPGLDDLVSRLGQDKVRIIRQPRDRYFSFSLYRNVGIRYTSSDLLLFLDADLQLAHTGVLRENVERLLDGSGVDHRYFRDQITPITSRDMSWWTRRQRLHDARVGPRLVYVHCLGSPLLVRRSHLQALGGYNEAMRGWGYEDTDILARLEFNGFGRIPMEGIIYTAHDDADRVKNFKQKQKNRSWERNERASNLALRLWGSQPHITRFPGRTSWIEIDGARYDGVAAPQQNWEIDVSRMNACLYQTALFIDDQTYPRVHAVRGLARRWLRRLGLRQHHLRRLRSLARLDHHAGRP